jgi:hypothetical protein
MMKTGLATFEGRSYDGPFELHEEQHEDLTISIITSAGIPFMLIVDSPEVAERLLVGFQTQHLQVIDKFEKYYVRH